MLSVLYRFTLLCLGLFIFFSLPALAAPERRIALVIGNSSYEAGGLKNPVNDAVAMAASLEGLGFQVALKKNVNQEGMETAIRDLGARLKKGGVGLFFYAGHGVQIAGRNYLLPVGARIDKDTDVKYRAVDAEMILDEMGNAGNAMNIVILDACRDNPFGKSYRTANRGLAIIAAAPRGTFISYSTSPGNVAADGGGANSPYTAALLRHMRTPGLPIEEVFKSVRRDLGRQTHGRQTPWELSSLEGQFFFNANGARPPAAGDAAVADMDASSPAPQDARLAFTDAVTGMEFIRVKGGCYDMGDGFGDGAADEKPVHEVCVADYYLGKYEVTQGQWEAVMGENPSYFKACGANCPVENVSWEDAQEFIAKLNGKTGKRYRLPTEAEWEYAARSGGKPEKYAGTSSDSDLGRYAWYDGNSGNKTHPVGEKEANGLGIYDMTGNVWEWCEDWYGKKYYGESPRQNPRGPSAGEYRVLRGGSWNNEPWLVRAAGRSGYVPAGRLHSNGFRLSLSGP